MDGQLERDQLERHVSDAHGWIHLYVYHQLEDAGWPLARAVSRCVSVVLHMASPAGQLHTKSLGSWSSMKASPNVQTLSKPLPGSHFLMF